MTFIESKRIRKGSAIRDIEKAMKKAINDASKNNMKLEAMPRPVPPTGE
jgi:hypothetical protein